jgi:hypothetical protein
MLLDKGLLQQKVGLSVKEVATAANGLSLTGRMREARALSRKASLGPKTVLADDLFHALKPPRIRGVIIWKIK